MDQPIIYLDNHATTRVDPRVVEAMLPYFTQYYGNASSTSHELGRQALQAVELARQVTADAIGAAPRKSSSPAVLPKVTTWRYEVLRKSGAAPVIILSAFKPSTKLFWIHSRDWRATALTSLSCRLSLRIRPRPDVCRSSVWPLQFEMTHCWYRS